MPVDQDLAAYREAVLSLLNDGLATVTLACCIVILLLATQVVRHW